MTRNKKVLLAVLLSPVVLVALIVGGFLSYYGLSKANQISPSEASKLCQNFYADVQSQLKSASGYTVAKSVTHCTPEQDEAGFTDYTLGVDFKIARSDASDVSTKAALDQLTQKLPHKNYHLSVLNVQNGEPYICVSAGRYIDNDGSDVPQGDQNGPFTTFVVPGSINDYHPCEDF
ncbi:MAG TPA: hypothetical protein VLI54_04295 [Bacillota bacterium]|nr:hypothetical protein [Bacillota bacterium]